MSNFDRIDYLLPNLLVLPMVSQWLLPEGMERILFIDILGITFYFPNICYFLYIYLYNNNQRNFREFDMPSIYLHTIVGCMFFFFFYLLIDVGIARIGDAINIFVNDFAFIYSFVLFFYFPLPLKILDKCKYLMLGALFVLSLEVILYSTGLMSYTSAAGTDLLEGQYETAGIFRVSTTIGAATGSAIIIAALGMLCSSFFYFNSLTRIFVLLLTTVTIFMTISRGSIIVWGIYLLFYIYVSFLKNTTFEQRIKVFIVSTIVIIGAVNMGLFAPVMERQSRLNESENVYAGRDSKNDFMLGYIAENDYFGSGAGMFYPDKCLQGKYETKNNWGHSPHNSYLLILAELGIIGLLLFIIIYVGVIIDLDYSQPIAMTIPFVFLINFSTENFTLYQECIPLIAFMLLSVYKYNYLDDDIIYFNA